MYEARLRTNLPLVEARIEHARSRAGGEPVTIVAVTKGHPPAAAAAAAALGMSACGENRVQELEDKRAELGPIDIRWHLIGHLQRNKVRRALPLFDMIHSVDSLRLARELSAEAVRTGRTVDALVQVNASGEETKGGFAAEQGSTPIGAVCALPNLHIRGLMTMAPFTADEPIVRATFARTRELFLACARDIAEFRAEHLSMGMSNDFEMAVEEGATMVRLGTVLFGEREP